MKLYILQYRGTSLISKLIRLVTWGDYSHSAIASSDGTIVEAWEGAGVRHAMSPWENHTLGTVIDVFELSAEGKYRRIWNEALLRVGNEYDLLSLIGFLPFLRYFWKDTPNKFFCSHFVAFCCRLGGAPLFSQQTSLYKLSPSKIPWSPRLKWRGYVTNEDEWAGLLNEMS